MVVVLIKVITLVFCYDRLVGTIADSSVQRGFDDSKGLVDKNATSRDSGRIHGQGS